MANIKITELDAATTLASTDVLVAVDVSEDVTKKTTVTNLFRTLPDGTAAAPALAFSSSQANGVYLAGTDTVGISTGGTQRFTVDGSGNVTISGGLTVEGQTTTVESTIVTIDDKNIELGSVASPSNTTADGGGITLKGTTDKTIKWINSTGYWTFNTGIEVGGNIQIDDNSQIRIGTDADLKLYHSGSSSVLSNNTGGFVISNGADDEDIVLQADNGSGAVTTYIRCDGSIGSVRLSHYGTEKLRTVSTGIDVFGELECDSLDVDGALDIDGGQIYYDAANNNLHFIDNVKARFGTGSDLRIYHDGSNSYIDDAGTGVLNIRSNDLRLGKYTGELGLQIIADGETRLHYDNSVKLATKTGGVDVTGEVQCDSLDVDGNADISGTLSLLGNLDMNDSDRIRLGDGDDLEIYHDGSNSYIKDAGSGDLIINATNLQVKNHANNAIYFTATNGGAFTAYHNNVYKFATKSDGVNVIGELECDSLDVDGSADITGTVTLHNNLDLQDDDKILLGTSDDLAIYHSTNSHIDNYVGELAIRNFADDLDITLQTDSGSGGIATYVRCDGSSGSVTLGHYGTTKLQTKSDGIDVTGEVQCDSLDVDGSADFTGDVAFRGGANAVEISANSDIRFINGSWTGDYGAKIQQHSNTLYIQGGSSGIIFRDPDGTDRVRIDANGHLHPNGSNNYDLGTSSNQWRNAFFDGTVNADGLDVDGAGDISGSLQIGSTSSANSSLSVRSSTSGDGGYYFNDGSNAGAIIYNHASNYMKFRVNGSDKGQFDSSGRLMLGTTTEGATSADNLTINDSGDCGLTLRSGTSSAGNIFFSDATSGTSEYDGYIQYSHASRYLRFGTAATERFRITSTGAWAIEGASNYGTSGQVLTSNGNDAPTWQDAGSVSVGGGSSISMNDSVAVNFGASQDLQIFHDSSNSFIRQAGIGDLIVQNIVNDKDVLLQSDDGSGGVTTYLACDGGDGKVKLYQYGNERLQTTSGGVDVTGSLIASANVEAQNNMHVNDGKKYQAGNANDLTLYHNGADSFIDNATGDLYIRGIGDDLYLRSTDDIFIQPQGNDNGIVVKGDAEVELYYNNSQKLETTSFGVDVTGEVQCDSLDVDGGANITGNVDIDAYIRHNGDDNTYFGFGNNDLFAVITAGTERFRAASNGQLLSTTESSTTLKPFQGCRAFCCFKGTGTVSIFSSFNVSSLVDVGTGAYEVYFTTAPIDTGYAVTTGFQRNGAHDEFVNVGFSNTTARVKMEFFDSGNAADCQRLSVAVYR